MRTIAIIPARYAATRFHAKLMQSLIGKPVIQHTYENTLATQLFDEVWVACDSQEIYDLITRIGGKAFMSKEKHESGTDRIAELAQELDGDIFVNVQGDEPFVNQQAIQTLLDLFKQDPQVQVASLMQALTEQGLIQDPNYVKVVCDLQHNALFFSRSIIPYPRNNLFKINYYEHVGIYGFSRKALTSFPSLAPTAAEQAEKIECLRFLEHGIPIRMGITQYMGIEIDTPEDLVHAEQRLRNN